MQNKPQIITGGKQSDDRGELIYFNDFDMSGVKRFYQIANASTSSATSYPIRAWQGHKFEEKYFYVNQGTFFIAVVKIDDWSYPSKNLKAEKYILTAKEPKILNIPAGYANGIKPLEANSLLIIYSTVTLEESLKDDYRYDKNLWINWDDK